MDAYEFGVNLALTKLATSRWKESIRSGEVSPEAANRMKREMGFDPKRHGKGLELGAKRHAKRLGYDTLTHSPKEYSKEVGRTFKRGIPGAKESLDIWKKRLLSAPSALMGGGAATNPATRTVNFAPSKLNKIIGEGTMPIVAVHETMEAALANKMGLGPYNMENAHRQIPATKAKRLGRMAAAARDIPAMLHGQLSGPGNAAGTKQHIQNAIQDILQKGYNPFWMHPSPILSGLTRIPLQGVHTSQHASAEPIISDIREGRLLGGKGQANIEKMRKGSGEVAELQEASRRITGKSGYLPKKQILQIAEQMKAQNLARGAEIAGAEAGPITSRIVKGIPALRRLLGR